MGDCESYLTPILLTVTVRYNTASRNMAQCHTCILPIFIHEPQAEWGLWLMQCIHETGLI